MDREEMKEPKNSSVISELETFLTKLKSYRRYVEPNRLLMDTQKRYRDSLRDEIVRISGALKALVIELTGRESIRQLDIVHIIWDVGLTAHRLFDVSNVALDSCIDAVNEAIGKLTDDINNGVRDKKGNLININKSSSISTESPLEIFDAMHLHPNVVKASKSLFETGHYTQAIFEAFKAVENFVKDKSGLSSYGKNLMAGAFNEDKPLIQVPEAGHFDKDVQEGFKFLFMGATLGIRNPKAHKEIIQKDPYITLEYLGFASFLLKRIDYW